MDKQQRGRRFLSRLQENREITRIHENNDKW